MAFTPITLTGKYSDGVNPMSGTVTVTLSQVIANGGVIAVPNSKVLTLDNTGAFSGVFPAVNDPGTVPQGAFYEVTEELLSGDEQAQQRDYSIAIPCGASGATIDISTLMPGTPEGFDPTSNLSGTIQWTTFLDMPEVLGWLQFTDTPLPGSMKSGLLQRVIDAACYTGQDMANRPLCPTTMFNRYDGWAGEYIQLDYSPVLKLVQCQEWQSTGGFIQLPESTPESPTEGVQVNYRTGRIMRTFAGYSWPRPFFPGSRNIEVTYIAGYDPVPSDVWLATIDLVAYWWRNAEQASRTFTAGGNQYGGEQTTPQSVGLWPGIPNRIAAVFDGYRLPVIG
jgi:hypothetical protein